MINDLVLVHYVFVNDVDILDRRYLFFTDSDWLYPRKHFMASLLRADARGR